GPGGPVRRAYRAGFNTHGAQLRGLKRIARRKFDRDLEVTTAGACHCSPGLRQDLPVGPMFVVWHKGFAGARPDHKAPCLSEFTRKRDFNGTSLADWKSERFPVKVANVEDRRGKCPQGNVMIEKDADAIFASQFPIRPKVIIIPGLPAIGTFGA